MGLSFCDDSLGELKETAHILNGIYSCGIVMMILDGSKTGDTQIVTRRLREIGWQPKLNIFRVICDENEVDSIEKVVDTTHV